MAGITLFSSFYNQKCNYCNKYLTVGPIYTTSVDWKQFKCGRCSHIASTYSIENFNFEEFLKSNDLKCCYVGCEEKLVWGQVQQHELNCPFREMLCPLGCGKNIKVSDLRTHFQDYHPTQILINQYKSVLKYYELNVENPFAARSFCLLINDKMFILFLRNITKNIHPDEQYKYNVEVCGIYSIFDPKGAKFELTLSPIKDESTEDASTICFSKNVIQFNDHLHCFSCLQNYCRTTFHTKSAAKMLEEMIHLTNTKEILTVYSSNDANLDYKIVIKIVEQDAIPKNETTAEDFLKQISDKLENCCLHCNCEKSKTANAELEKPEKLK